MLISNSEHVKICIIYQSIYLKGIKWDEMTLCVDPIFSWRIKSKRFLHGIFGEMIFQKMDQENRHWIAVHAILTFVAYLIIAWYTFHIFCCWYCWVGNVNTVIDIYFPSKKRSWLLCSKMVETEKKPCCNFGRIFFTSGNFMIKVYFFLFETLRFDKLWHYRMNSKQGNF